MKHALITLNIGNILCDNARASFVAAAQRWNCDYIEVTEASPGVHPWAMKLLAFEVCPCADRICYIDADTVISDRCPNPFDVFPEDAFIAVDNQQPQMTQECINACADTMAQDLRAISNVFDPIPIYASSFINSGFWLATKKHHQEVLALALKVSLAMYGVTAWRDQSALNYALIITRIPVLKAPETWNYQFPPDTKSGCMARYIYHWAGGEKRDQIAGVNWHWHHDRKPRLLWIGDAICHTGFARVTHNVLAHLSHTWDVHLIGINYSGDPHQYPYPIYPARNGGDMWGINRMRELLEKIQPDAICILQDPWIATHYLQFRAGAPMAAYMPIDARNQDPRVCAALNALDLAIFYTSFGEKECRIPGYAGRSAIIPHGVDLGLYHPVDKAEARRKMDISELPPKAFIFGNINRNSPRKRLDLTIQYFAEWLRQRAGAADRITDAYLYIHCSPKDTAGLDLAEMASYFGIAKKFILPPEDLITPAVGVPEDQMKYVYGSLDVQISTSAGEGWGLPQMEGAACGIPQIVPQFSGLGEWIAGAAYMVPCTTAIAHPNINTIGEMPDKTMYIRALDLMYRNATMRKKYSELALARARDPMFDWSAIAAQFDSQLRGMIEPYAVELAKFEVAQKQKQDNASKDQKQYA